MGWQQQGPSGAGKPFTLLFWFEEGLSPSSNQTRRVHGLPAPLEPCCLPMDPQVCQFLPLTASRGLTTPGEGAPTNSERLSNKLRTLTLSPGGEVGEGTHQFRTFSEHLPPPPPLPRDEGWERRHPPVRNTFSARVSACPEPRTGFTRPQQSLCFVTKHRRKEPVGEIAAASGTNVNAKARQLRPGTFRKQTHHGPPSPFGKPPP